MDNNHKNSDQLNMENKYLSLNYKNKIIILKYIILCNVHLCNVYVYLCNVASFLLELGEGKINSFMIHL